MGEDEAAAWGGGVAKAVFFLCFLFITYIVPHCWYMVWLKEKRKTLLHDQIIYIYKFYVEMNMMYVNCYLGNNKK
jgi:hypothetical protein